MPGYIGLLSGGGAPGVYVCLFMMRLLVLVLASAIFGRGISAVYAASRTTPPAGSVVVNPSATTSQFSTLSSAVASLPNDSSNQTIFMFPGTYEEQVLVDRPGPVTVRHVDTNDV